MRRHMPRFSAQNFPANLALVARLVATAALQRTESRGAHHRADHPGTDPAWARHIDVRIVDGAVVTIPHARDRPPFARHEALMRRLEDAQRPFPSNDTSLPASASPCPSAR